MTPTSLGNHMAQIITSSSQQINKNFSETTNGRRVTTRNFSPEIIESAKPIILKRTPKFLFCLIGRLLEIGGWCNASRQSLAYMLSEKTGKILCKEQIGRITNLLVKLKLITKSQTMSRGLHSYNEYDFTELGWALFYLYNFRIPKYEKCLAVEDKNVSPLITKRFNEEIYINNNQPRVEIYRETKSDDKKEVVNDINKMLEDRLEDVNREVADTVRKQARKYMTTNSIKSPSGFFSHLIERETQRRYNRFDQDREQQDKFRAKAHAEIERTKAFTDGEKKTIARERLNFIAEECRRRLHDKET